MEDTRAATTVDVLVFHVKRNLLAVPAEAVVRVELAPELATLPGSPEFISGVLNLAGKPLPVVCMRARLGGTPRNVRSSDRIVIVESAGTRLALLVDGVDGLKNLPASEDSWQSDGLPRGVRSCVGADGEIYVVQNVEELLSADERDELSQLLQLAQERLERGGER